MNSDPLRKVVRRLSSQCFTDKTFYRFLIVGCSNFVVSFSIFWFCLRIPVQFPYKASASQLIAYSVATLWSFFWNRRLTFNSSGPVFRQLRRFVVLQISLAVISAGLIGFAIESAGWPATSSWFVVMSGITVANFLLCKWWAMK